jgi:hypothetical protein
MGDDRNHACCKAQGRWTLVGAIADGEVDVVFLLWRKRER